MFFVFVDGFFDVKLFDVSFIDVEWFVVSGDKVCMDSWCFFFDKVGIIVLFLFCLGKFGWLFC